MLATTEFSGKMTERQPNITGSSTMEIKSRFGELVADVSKAIYFPKGILGFPEDLHFSLMNFPAVNEQLNSFKILQCLNDHSISIPVMPVNFDNRFIETADMEECLKAVEVKKENLALLFIMSSSKQIDGAYKLFINVKAPIVVDTSLQMAVQYVFTNNKYDIRQSLDSGVN